MAIDYNTCRWCKWFKEGCCTNENSFSVDKSLEIYKFYEEGTLSEAIREGFKNYCFEKLEAVLIESKLSKKKVKEILQVFEAELELDAQFNWTESIDDSVSTALNNFDFGESGGVYIADPNECSCKYFYEVILWFSFVRHIGAMLPSISKMHNIIVKLLSRREKSRLRHIYTSRNFLTITTPTNTESAYFMAWS